MKKKDCMERLTELLTEGTSPYHVAALVERQGGRI